MVTLTDYKIHIDQLCNFKRRSKQPSCEKCVAPKSQVKRMCNPRLHPRNGCDGRLMAIHVLLPSFTGTYLLELLLLKFLPYITVNLSSQPFLGCPSLSILPWLFFDTTQYFAV